MRSGQAVGLIFHHRATYPSSVTSPRGLLRRFGVLRRLGVIAAFGLGDVATLAGNSMALSGAIQSLRATESGSMSWAARQALSSPVR